MGKESKLEWVGMRRIWLQVGGVQCTGVNFWSSCWPQAMMAVRVRRTTVLTPSVSGLPSKNGLDPLTNNMNHACSQLLIHLSQESTRMPLPVCGMNLKPQCLALCRNSTKLCWKTNKQTSRQMKKQQISNASAGLVVGFCWLVPSVWLFGNFQYRPVYLQLAFLTTVPNLPLSSHV